MAFVKLAHSAVVLQSIHTGETVLENSAAQRRGGAGREIDAAVLLRGARDGADAREVQPARREDGRHAIERGRPHGRGRGDGATVVAGHEDAVGRAVLGERGVEFEDMLEHDPPVVPRDFDDGRGQALCACVKPEIGRHYLLRSPRPLV
jgi:hypothetical protein